ncbi:CBO0543 family protein [Bacillus sp. 03113]|uniref:CBO0543 family protein n=1 Tax=Bacillus sp. 03113 TaxID=2578211 RepID=UPI0011447FE4|nr:CBO0543 family protein [Bacillus sp. 03113]
MSIAKQLKKSNSRSLPKKPFFFHKATLSTLLFASLIGTYLDLYFVGRNLYFFPNRPLEDIFTINIVFTLGVLPIYTHMFIMLIKNLTFFKRFLFIVLMSYLFTLIEEQSEYYGFFHHSEGWNHMYSFYGYLLFMISVWRFYRWMGERI